MPGNSPEPAVNTTISATLPISLVDAADVNTLTLAYFPTIPSNPNSGFGIINSGNSGSGLFIDDGGNIVLASNVSGVNSMTLAALGQFNLTSGNLATFTAATGFDFVSSGGGFTAEIGSNSFTFNGGIFAINGTDIKFNGNSILGGGGSFPDITDSGGFVGISQPAPAYPLDVAGDVNFTGNLYQNGVAFGGGFTPSGLAVQFLMGDGSYNSNDYLAINPAFISMVSDFLTLHPPVGGSTITFDQSSGFTRMASDNAGILWFDSSAGGFSIQSATGNSEINSNNNLTQLRRSGVGEVTVNSDGTLAIKDMSGAGISLDGLGNVSINNGFTGTGPFTNFTIVGGIITAAS